MAPKKKITKADLKLKRRLAPKDEEDEDAEKARTESVVNSFGAGSSTDPPAIVENAEPPMETAAPSTPPARDVVDLITPEKPRAPPPYNSPKTPVDLLTPEKK